MPTSLAARRRGRWSLSLVALLSLLPGCAVEPEAPDEHVGSTTQALDDVCTPDPTLGVPDVTWGTRWANTINTNGFDLYHLNVLGPHCESAPGTTGYDFRCCSPYASEYPACKAEQAQAAKAFLESFVAKTPLLRPYRSANVGINQGYFYNTGGTHTGALDIAKTTLASGEDPSFPVFAVANGTVIWSGWLSASAGNSVLVRHDLPGGAWYLSEYRHVRGGRNRDKINACSCINPGQTTAGSRLAGCSAEQAATPICKYAANPSYDFLWGSNSDTLPPLQKVVSRGEFLVAAGNTGTVELDSNGNPTSSSGKTHLHHSFWVPRPGPASDGKGGIDIVAVDPLGVYSKAEGQLDGKSCYDVSQKTAFAPALAPFGPVFSGVPRDAVLAQPLYFPNAGWGPQSLSFYRAGATVQVAGAFDPAVLTTSWKLWLELSRDDMLEKLTSYPTRKLRQLSVRLEDNTPRYTGIWEGLASGEHAETYLRISSTSLDAVLAAKVTNGAFAVADYVLHVENGVAQHNLTLSDAVGPTEFRRNQPLSQIESWDSTLQAQGWRPWALTASVGTTGGAVTFSGIWRKLSGTWEMVPEIAPAAFAALNETMTANGFRLHRAQGYDNGSRLLAIWSKPTMPVCGLPSCPRIGTCVTGQFKAVPVCPANNTCPNGVAPTNGTCLVPVGAWASANCINVNPLNCPPGTPAGVDCRVYNWEARTPSGALCDAPGGGKVCAANETSLCDAY